jgi:hypothetical protein
MDPEWGLVVAAVGDTSSTPKGPAIDIFNFGGGHYRTYRQHPQGVCHRRLQLWWCLLPDLLPAPPRGLAIDVFNFWTCSSSTLWISDGDQWWPLSEIPTTPPRGPAIDVFNFNGGRCQTCRQHPPGGPPSTSSTSVVATAGPVACTPHGVCHRRLQLLDLQLRHLPGPTVNFS